MEVAHEQVISSITRDQIEIIPYRFSQLLELSMRQEINGHGHLVMKGLIAPGTADQYMKNTSFGTNIIVRQHAFNEKKILFNGMVKEVSTWNTEDGYMMEVMAVSYTYLLDIKKKSRSFQDNQMTYVNLIEQIHSDYDHANAIVTVMDQPLNDFVIQYDETDWEFLVRLASRFSQGLYATNSFDGAKYYFGIPNIKSDDTITSHRYKTMTVPDNKNNESPTEDCHIQYEVEDYSCFNLGDRVIFKSTHCYIKSLEFRLIEGEMIGRYRLSTVPGLKQPYLRNALLQGLSISGTVLAIERDKVRVHIDQIDGAQDVEKAHWFCYSTIYASDDGSGWYCMPEIGDKVRIQFANRNDSSAFAMSSISQHNPMKEEQDRYSDYNVRYLRNPQGMEIMLTPDSVIIHANERSKVQLKQTGEITVHGQTSVSVVSENNISISAGNEISFIASDSINLLCGNKAEIDLDSSGTTTLKGSTVYTN